MGSYAGHKAHCGKAKRKRKSARKANGQKDTVSDGDKNTDAVSSKRETITLDAAKPFGCKYCCATFKLRQYLANHIQTVHKENPWECDECEQTFWQKTMLNQHKRAQHTHNGSNGSGSRTSSSRSKSSRASPKRAKKKGRKSSKESKRTSKSKRKKRERELTSEDDDDDDDDSDSQRRCTNVIHSPLSTL